MPLAGFELMVASTVWTHSTSPDYVIIKQHFTPRLHHVMISLDLLLPMEIKHWVKTVQAV